MRMIDSPKNMHALFDSLARDNPDTFVLFSCTPEGVITEKISYNQLEKKVHNFASYLLALGLKKNDRIALAFSNSVDLLILSWAAWSIGIVTVPLDTKNDTQELYRYKIKITKAKLLITQKEIFETIHKKDFPKIKIEVFSGFSHTLKKDIEWTNDFSHLALILFTSGTTGYPKGAKLSLLNLAVNAIGIRDWFKIESDDRFLVNLPLHHINSTTFCLATLLSGGSIVIPPSYSSSNFWIQVSNTQTTFTSIVQSIVYDQLNRESEYKQKAKNLLLNRIQIGSAPVIAQSVLEFQDKYHIPLYQGYGQTETALRVTGVPLNLNKDIYKKVVEENSIGIPMKWADLQIANDKGMLLGENEEGELIVKGDAVMSGYVGEEPAFRDGYFLTGDIGLFRIIEGQRFFFLTGRKKEIIIKGGINISPTAVENRLKKISSDIDQVYIIGMADDRYGEEIAAILCWKINSNIKESEKRLKNALLSGSPHITAYETPKYILSVTTANLPKTSTGKIQRIILKKQFLREQYNQIR